jgi:hypothetical protein
MSERLRETPGAARVAPYHGATTITPKHLLDRASTALPSITRYYDDAGEYVEGEGDILAAYIAKVLMADFPRDPDLGDGEIIAHLTAILDQAITDLTAVCIALETDETTTPRTQ